MEIKKGQVWECLISYGNWTKGYGYASVKDGYLYNSKREQEKISDFAFLKNHFKLIGTTEIEEEQGYKESNERPKQYNIGIDTFKRCESNMTREEILVCCKFNIDKYNWRTKGQDKEDLEKIINYAKWALEQF